MLDDTIIGVEAHFDACHHLPHHEGKCRNVHGHTWHVEVEVQARESSEMDDWVIDLSVLKDHVRSTVDELDHNTLNNSLETPTCENLIALLYSRLRSRLMGLDVDIVSIKVREGEGGWAVWKRK